MIRAEFDKKTGEIVIRLAVGEEGPKVYKPASGDGLDATVYDMALTTGGFQISTLKDPDGSGRNLEFNISAGYLNTEQKAKKQAAQRKARAARG